MADWIMALIMGCATMAGFAGWLLNLRQQQVWNARRLERIEKKVDALTAALAAAGLHLPAARED